MDSGYPGVGGKLRCAGARAHAPSASAGFRPRLGLGERRTALRLGHLLG